MKTTQWGAFLRKSGVPIRPHVQARTSGFPRRDLSLFANREYRTSMLKPQDLFVVLRLALVRGEPPPTFAALAAELGMSSSEVHAAVKRAAESGLVGQGSRQVNRSNLLEFLLHGVRYAFPPQRSGVTRGLVTSYAAPPLRDSFSVGDLPPVWPHPHGTTRGEGLAPLYRSAPDAALRNPELHEWLALVDAVRAGRGRERALAAKELTRRLAT